MRKQSPLKRQLVLLTDPKRKEHAVPHRATQEESTRVGQEAEGLRPGMWAEAFEMVSSRRNK